MKIEPRSFFERTAIINYAIMLSGSAIIASDMFISRIWRLIFCRWLNETENKKMANLLKI